MTLAYWLGPKSNKSNRKPGQYIEVLEKDRELAQQESWKEELESWKAASLVVEIGTLRIIW